MVPRTCWRALRRILSACRHLAVIVFVHGLLLGLAVKANVKRPRHKSSWGFWCEGWFEWELGYRTKRSHLRSEVVTVAIMTLNCLNEFYYFIQCPTFRILFSSTIVVLNALVILVYFLLYIEEV